jgi:hypothetical protein
MRDLSIEQLYLLMAIVLFGIFNFVVDQLRKRNSGGRPPDSEIDGGESDPGHASELERTWPESVLEPGTRRETVHGRSPARGGQAEPAPEGSVVREWERAAEWTPAPEREAAGGPLTVPTSVPVPVALPEPLPRPVRAPEPIPRPARGKPAFDTRTSVATAAPRPRSGPGSWIDPAGARRGIVFMTLLGPCRGLDPDPGGPPGARPGPRGRGDDE